VQFEDRKIEFENTNTGIRGKTTPETWALWKQGYVVLKDFIPKEIINMTLDTWKTVENTEDFSNIIYREGDIIHNSPQDSLEKSMGCYNAPWGVALHRYCWDKLKGVIDMNLGETYSYSRKYERGAYLKAHADRPSCEISATLCLEYQSDDERPWPIWVDNSTDWVNKPNEIYEQTQAIPIKKRRKESKSVLLEPGDLLMYQGPNVAHWREYFLGSYSYHIFLHFYNKAGKTIDIPGYDELHAELLPQKDGATQPCRYDGRRSRYHGIDPKSEERRLFDSFQEEFWNSDYWDNKPYKKSDFINNFEEYEYFDRKAHREKKRKAK
tara:strand:+ start:21876 stop:22847 length:972 start_codon:yes stop_codon:yes gene_type:complete